MTVLDENDESRSVFKPSNSFFCCFSTALPFYAWELIKDERTALNPNGILALIYVAGPGGALMYYLFNLSVKALGASRAGVFLYRQTAFVAILAYFFLGERLLPYHVAGAFFILVGVLLVLLLKPRGAHNPRPAVKNSTANGRE